MFVRISHSLLCSNAERISYASEAIADAAGKPPPGLYPMVDLNVVRENNGGRLFLKESTKRVDKVEKKD